MLCNLENIFLVQKLRSAKSGGVMNKQLENKLSSREVAQMMDLKQHSDLLRKIDGINEDFTQSKIAFSKYWTESSYIDGSGKSNREFQITKKGCEFLAHKTTGTKGNLFTDKYMDKFEQMKEIIEEEKSKLPTTYKEALLQLVQAEEEKELLQLENAQKNQIINELQPKATYYDFILQNKSLLAISVIAKDFGMSAKGLNKKLHELKVQYLQCETWLLYAKYQDKGYTSSKTQNYPKSDGTQGSKLHTYWTQKGRLFIYDLLKQEGILPLIEREVA